MRLGLASEMDIAGSIGVALTPRPTQPHWELQWNRILAILDGLAAPNTTTLSGNEILAARDRTTEFFVLTAERMDQRFRGAA